MTTILPPPSTLLGLPPDDNSGFTDWYPNQDMVVSRVLDWLSKPEPKFMCAALPTGSGKSVLAAIAAQMGRTRAGVLTATKGLQDQFLADFHRIGFQDIRGQNAYPCVLLPSSGIRVDAGPCHAGVPCPHREKDCIYYAQLAKAASSKFVITNYSFWLAQSNIYAQRGGGIGRMGLLIMDEADEAFGAIESYLSLHISTAECRAAGITLDRIHCPTTWDGWRQWAHDNLPQVEQADRRLKQRVQMSGERGVEQISKTDMERARQVQDLVRKLSSIRGSLGEWVWRDTGGGRSGGGFGIYFTPVWPGKYSNLVFGNSDKVLVMSATLTEKTVDLLGIPKEDRIWMELGSTYSPSRTPIYPIKTVRVDHRSSDIDMRAWVNCIDQIIDRRLDRKGIVLPVSYNRSDFFCRNSRHRNIIVTHGRGDVIPTVEYWRKLPAPAVLVSPSVVRGWDFPHDECRYIVIGKIPFPDGRDPVIKARSKEDPEFVGYDTMQTIVQEAGRGTRSPDDWCEVFVSDGHFGSWWWYRNQQFAPQFFKERMRRPVDVIPDPPPATGFR